MQSDDYSHLRHRTLEKTLANRIKRAHDLSDAQQSSRSRAVCGAGLAMTTRSRRETITFQHPFRIKGIDRSLPAGDYEVITDEEMIEGLSFCGVPPGRSHDRGSCGAPAQFNDGDDFHRFGRFIRRSAH
jgi:hypothetical protein